jgi:hypothetical protein
VLAENCHDLRHPSGIGSIRFVVMGNMGYLFFPDGCESLIRSPDFTLSNDLSHQFSLAVMDSHAVTTEFTAYRGAGGIDRADKSVAPGIFLQEWTFFFRVFRSWFLLRAGNGNSICIFRLDVDKENIVRDAIPAIVIPVREFPLYPDKFPKTPAAFPAPVTDKFRHQ